MTCNTWCVSSKREQQEAAGRWLRQARDRRGLTTAGMLARRMDVSVSLISRYETGMSAVSDERAEQIAEALEMDLIEVRRGLGLWVPREVGGGASAEEAEPQFEPGSIRRRVEILIERRKLRQLDRALSLVEDQDENRDAG